MKVHARFQSTAQANGVVTFDRSGAVQFGLDYRWSVELIPALRSEVHNIVKPVRQRVGGGAVENWFAVEYHLSGPRSSRVIACRSRGTTVDANVPKIAQHPLRPPKLQLLHRARIDQLKSNCDSFGNIQGDQLVELLDQRYRGFFQIHEQLAREGGGCDFQVEMNGCGNGYRIELRFLFQQTSIICIPADIDRLQPASRTHQGFAGGIGNAHQTDEALGLQLRQRFQVGRA